MSVGGGRKGLPASFLNRFSKIYVEDYTTDEQLSILSDVYKENTAVLDQSIFEQLISGLKSFADSVLRQHFSKVNLRDMLRFKEIYLRSGCDLPIAFSLAFERQDFREYFPSAVVEFKQPTSIPNGESVRSLPVCYSYMSKDNEKLTLLSSQRKTLSSLMFLLTSCSKYCSSFLLTGKSGSGKT